MSRRRRLHAAGPWGFGEKWWGFARRKEWGWRKLVGCAVAWLGMGPSRDGSGRVGCWRAEWEGVVLTFIHPERVFVWRSKLEERAPTW